MTERTWTLIADAVPTEGGYYMTRYYNPEREEWLYKALYYNPETAKWIGPWHWSYDRIGPFPQPGKFHEDGAPRLFWRIEHKGLTVEKYDPNSRTDYYGQQFKAALV